MPIRSGSVFREVVESTDEKVLVRLERPDGVVQEVWVELDQVRGLEPGARIELIEEDEAMSPRIVRVDRGSSP